MKLNVGFVGSPGFLARTTDSPVFLKLFFKFIENGFII